MTRDREEYDNTNRGVLFENDRRRGNDRAPLWKGQATIKTPDGELVEFWISGWEQRSRNGDDFISLSFEEKEAGQYRSRGGGGGGRRRDDDDDRGSRRRRDDDDDRGSRARSRDDDGPRSGGRERDDNRRRRDDDRAQEDDRRATQRELDDEVPF